MSGDVLAIVAFATFSALAAALLLVGAPLRQPDPYRRRIEALTDGAMDKSGEGSRSDRPRGKSVKAVLREIEEAQRKRSRLTLALRLRQAGLEIRQSLWLGLMAGLAMLTALLLLVLGLSEWVVASFALAAGVGLPELALRVLRARRLRRMADEFPNAVDVVVRSVKSGLPLPDALRIISNEANEPLRSEFGKVVRDQTAGLPMPEAVERLAQRVPLSEANFFAIVISIQFRTGGSLSESLSNLSKVLRERKKMQNKIKAMSSEAKASGAIIGALPIVVSVIIYLTSPEYMSLLFETYAGNMVILGSAVWMLIGILVMRKMINFSY